MTTFGIRGVTQARADPNNAALVRQNLELNGITGQVLGAAIGPNEGTARFDPSEPSNLLSEDGSLSVPMISVATIIKKFAVESFALVKIDIKGGEQGLFDGPTGWLARADAIIIEFHPPVDHFGCISQTCNRAAVLFVRSFVRKKQFQKCVQELSPGDGIPNAFEPQRIDTLATGRRYRNVRIA